MERKKCIVVFGGAFNPPLNSHFSIAQEVLNQFEQVEKVVFVPVNKEYPKDGLLDNKYRYEMLKLVIDKNSKFILSDIDMKENRVLSTLETLEEIKKQFRNKEILFLLGSDNLKELYTWKDAKELVSKFEFLVMERNQDIMEEIIENDKLLKCHKENFLKVNSEIKSNCSSTYVRKQIKNNKSIRYLLPDEVLDYIEKNNLYRS